MYCNRQKDFQVIEYLWRIYLYYVDFVFYIVVLWNLRVEASSKNILLFLKCSDKRWNFIEFLDVNNRILWFWANKMLFEIICVLWEGLWQLYLLLFYD